MSLLIIFSSTLLRLSRSLLTAMSRRFSLVVSSSRLVFKRYNKRAGRRLGEPTDRTHRWSWGGNFTGHPAAAFWSGNRPGTRSNGRRCMGRT
ncbi:hypothetical protein C8Q79DRAFT_7221 [Trametes meyenii]|nr:hypothetical protein C8Q79DRAFT_7221 [Trametes meyenii]